MITLDQVIYVLPLLGIMVSILYYTMVLRNSNRTRAAQLFMSLHSIMANKEGMSDYLETMYMDWDDYADFERKYGSDNNPKAYAQRLSIWNALNNYGVLLKKGMRFMHGFMRRFGHRFGHRFVPEGKQVTLSQMQTEQSGVVV